MPTERRLGGQEEGYRDRKQWSGHTRQAYYGSTDEDLTPKRWDGAAETKSSSASTPLKASLPSVLCPAVGQSPPPLLGGRPGHRKSSTAQRSTSVERAPSTTSADFLSSPSDALLHEAAFVPYPSTSYAPNKRLSRNKEDDASGNRMDLLIAAAGSTPARRAKTPSGVKRDLTTDPSLPTRKHIASRNQSTAVLRSELLRVCSTRDLYRKMLAMEGSEAQRWIDNLQLVGHTIWAA